ncbi:MAG: CDP-archaeol synthase [Acidimicrobiia bacterium]|nr:CDP-archaeol synthase [Acidimicrobiia bacterium]
MADNKRRGRFGRGSDDDAPQSIFDLFEPPPEQDAASFTRIPIIRDDADVELDLTDSAMVEAQVAADVEAGGLAHWTEPPTGQVPKSLASAVSQDDKWADVRGPSWQGEEPNWAGPDLSDVFADTQAISHRRVVETDDEDLRSDPTSAMPLPGRQLRNERPAPGAFDAPGQPRVSPPPPSAPADNGFDARRGVAGTPPAPSVFGDQPAVAGRPAGPPPGAAAFDDRPNPRPAAAPAGPSALDQRSAGGDPGADERPAGRDAPSAFDPPPPSGRGVSSFDERQAAAGRGVPGLDERQAAAGRGVPGLDSRRSPRGRAGFDEQPPVPPGARSVFDERRRLGAPPPPAPAARPSPPPAPAARPAAAPAQSGPQLRAGGPGPAGHQPGPPPPAPGPAGLGPVGGRLHAPDHNLAGGPPAPAARAPGPEPDPGAARRGPAPRMPDGRGRASGVRLEGGDLPGPQAGPGAPPPARRGAHDAPLPGGDPDATLRPARVPPPDRGPAPTRAMPQPQGAPVERNGRFEQPHPLHDPAGRFEAGPPSQRQAAAPPETTDDEGFDLGPAAAAARGRESSGGVGQRVAVGVALVALVAVALGLGPAVTMLLVGLITLLAVMELFNTMRIAGLRPATLLGLVGAVALPAAAYVRGETGYPLVIGLAVIFGMLWYLTGADTERPVLNLGLTFLGVLWVGGLAGFAALMLRAEESIQLLGATIAITAISDAFAYFGGRAYGTKPFHPASPKKTWEGTFTGFFGALLTGLLIGLSGQFSLFDGHFTAVMALAALVGILAPIGDLAESLVKRDLGVKDMGSLLPGHGGVLDRIDGLLFALPGAYYMAVIFGLF